VLARRSSVEAETRVPKTSVPMSGSGENRPVQPTSRSRPFVTDRIGQRAQAARVLDHLDTGRAAVAIDAHGADCLSVVTDHQVVRAVPEDGTGEVHLRQQLVVQGRQELGRIDRVEIGTDAPRDLAVARRAGDHQEIVAVRGEGRRGHVRGRGVFEQPSRRGIESAVDAEADRFHRVTRVYGIFIVDPHRREVRPVPAEVHRSTAGRLVEEHVGDDLRLRVEEERPLGHRAQLRLVRVVADDHM